MQKLSVVLATRNEEENIGRCLESVRRLAGEIIVVDEYSTDRTREIAESFGTKVYLEPHHAVFHITKQKALDYATGDWILQLDADEVVTPALAREIKEILNNKRQAKKIPELFIRHQKLLEQRDGLTGKKIGEIVAFFVPRRNIFLGKPLIHAGVYPDGVIRLVKKGKAFFPEKSVHEQMEIDGKVSWLSNDLLHYDSPTLKRYFIRMNRYTDLHSQELKSKEVSLGIVSFFYYVFIKPLSVFLELYFRHKGVLDGIPGFLWSLFSSWHYPIAYFKYWTGKYN